MKIIITEKIIVLVSSIVLSAHIYFSRSSECPKYTSRINIFWAVAPRELVSNFRILTGKRHHQMKLKRLKKVWINIGIWGIATLNPLFLRGSYTKLKFSKNKVHSDKSAFFVIDPFLYSPLYLTWNWTLTGQFCIEMFRFQ